MKNMIISIDKSRVTVVIENKEFVYKREGDIL
jgi:hypothetical protein